MAASKRALAALAAGALIVPLSPFASPAFAAHIDIRSIETACPSNQLPENRFTDVDDDSTFEDEITCIAEYEVTSGKTATTYDPSGLVTRQQMAGFIANVLREAGFDLDTRDAGFTDLENVGNQGLVDSINALANAGVVVGTTPTATERKPFSPGQNVRRDQMASFIAQAQEALDRGVTTNENFFDDDRGNVHEANINKIASEGITGGRGGDRLYSPLTDVTREQMAAFLARKIDILVEEGLIEARFGPGSEVNITETTVNAGQPITGAISEAENVDTVTASGSCITGGAVTDSNTGTADTFEFRIPTRADAPAGDCVVTFTVTFDNGRQVTLTDTVRITTGNQSTNARPELLSAAVVSTTTPGQVTPTNPAGTVVRFTFDEAVLEQSGTTTSQPDVSKFFVFGSDGQRITGSSIVDVDGASVLVRFNSITTADAAARLTVATVDVDAVRDLEGNSNPEGDAPLGTTSAGGGTQALPAGVTDAPDLTAVGGFRQAATANTTAVDFTFDEAAFLTSTASASNFILVLTNGNEIAGQVIDRSTTTAGGQNIAGGNGTTTITVIFNNPGTPASSTPIAASSVARGVVLADTVAEVTDSSTATNALQAADVSNGGNTEEPDLVSVELRPGATAGAQDAALFTFDQVVNRADATRFFLYTTDGNEIVGSNARISTADGRQVLVDFATTDLVVGGNVRDAAVTATVSPTNLTEDTNSEDEVGVANTTTAAPGQTAGRTDGPDLTAVTLSRPTNEFGTPGNFVATYAFDEDVEAIVPGRFFLYLADGTRLVGTAASTATRTEENDNTVTITAFAVDANNDGVANSGEAASTSAQIGSAVLGTVNDGAVNEEGSGTLTNPEGAEPTAGGTGTRG